MGEICGGALLPRAISPMMWYAQQHGFRASNIRVFSCTIALV
jgi:hypothetical protein